ncbi:unnamed protein product, partial [Ixodes hexagonus]
MQENSEGLGDEEDVSVAVIGEFDKAGFKDIDNAGVNELDRETLDILTGCTSSGFTTPNEVTEPRGSRTGIPIAPSKSVPNEAGLHPAMEPPSPTKSLERRPPASRSAAIESLRTPEERGFKETPVLVHDARTGFASNLKLLAENTVNEVDSMAPMLHRRLDPASNEGSGEPVAEAASDVSSAQGSKVVSEVAQNCIIETMGAPTVPVKLLPEPDFRQGDSLSTGTPPCDDLSPSGTPVMASGPVEIVVDPPPLPPQPPPAPRVTREVATQVAPPPEPERRPEDRPGIFREEPQLAGSTQPLNEAAIMRNEPMLRQRQPHRNTIRPVSSPLISRWCCAKISFVSMAVMSLFAAFMFYAFKEDTFVDLVNW